MGTIMNRRLTGMLTTAFAFCIILSCSERSTTDPTAHTLTDTTHDESRVASATVTLAQSTLVVGQTTQATAVLRDSQNRILNRVVLWSSSNTSVATVSASGLVTALSAGTADIIATRGLHSARATLTVTPSTVAAAPVASVTVVLPKSTLGVGQTTQAVDTTRDSTNKVLTGTAVVWTSSNVTVATIASSGMITARAVGTSVIAATSGAATGTAPLSVTTSTPPPVASISVTPASSSVLIGATAQLSATTRDASNNLLTGRVVTWSSANAGIASVNSSGLVSGVSAGTTQVTATSEGISSSATITVTAATPLPGATVTVSPTTANLQVGATVQLVATERDINNTLLTGRVVTWSSSNIGISTVSSTGLVAAVSPGNATITATSEGQSGSASLSVQVPGSTNEPPGMTVISDRPFNALNELGWFDNEYKTGNQTIVADATAPISPPNVVRIHLPAGSGEGGGQGSGDYTLPNQRTLYVRYAGKFSSNWQGSSSGVDKTFYVYTSTGVPSVYFNMSGSGVTVKVPQMAGQDMIFPGPGNFSDPVNPDFKPNLVPSATVPLGTWHTIELVLVGNTAGNRDGSFDWYVNGVHVGSQSGIQFTSGAAVWNLFHYTLLYSGNVSSNPTNAQDVFFDHIYLSGKQ